jgi:hypothetical protein
MYLAGFIILLFVFSITAFTTNLSMVAQQIVTLVMLVWGVHLFDAKVITGGVLFVLSRPSDLDKTKP